MKAAEFDYIRADSVAAVCEALAAAGPGEEHKIVAGGQTLVPLMAMRLARPTLLVDIDGIPGLDGIDAGNGVVAVGAMTRQRAAELSPAIREDVPLLAKALRFVGHLQTRNRGTVGGSLVHGDPAAEIPLAAVALDAELEAEGTGGRRVYPANGFFEGPMFTAIAADECLVEARFPVWNGARVGTGFREVASRQGDFAIVAAAAQVALDGDGRCTRVAAALGGVAPRPVRIAALEDALAGTRMEDDGIDAALGAIDGAIEPDDDLHATAAYRARVARVLLGRAIREARDEAAP
ncbi:MAG: FAD binding domain-containing protein [Defluviicoccus sp.]|nr:FAD binding domain-containing protein [Defluviicoccus sp.]